MSTPRSEVKELIDNVPVPPGYRSTDAPEDDFLGYEQPYLIHIETVVSCCVQTWECARQIVGYGLSLTCICLLYTSDAADD